MIEYQSSTHAKCIIAGEHSVLRSSNALVFPFTQRTLQLNYQFVDNFFVDVDTTEYAANLALVFQEYFQLGTKIIAPQQINLKGKFTLKNTIPMGMGLGFSAAMCVSLAKWLHWKKCLKESQIFSFAHKLEQQFHGKSSGLDIAGVLYNKPILFNAKKSIKEIEMDWLPHLYISFTTSSSGTKKCITKVEDFIKKEPQLSKKIDLEMNNAVAQAVDALQLPSVKGIIVLAKAISRAANCFKMWQLITPEMKAQMNFLLQQGALAAKPTGSGGGGCVLSLWRNSPPVLPFELIAVN